MVSFISKKIKEEEENFGEQLKRTRERTGLGIEEVSNIIGINAKYLSAFEENKFDELPEGVYADKFLKRYAQYLGLENIILLFPMERQNEQKELQQLKIKKDSVSEKIKNYILNPKFLKNALILLVAICGVVYLYSIAYNIVKPPKLNIVSPNDDFVTTSYAVEIRGETEDETKIFINDKEVFCSQGGIFNEEIDLSQGLNVVKISAKKKYSKENIIYRKILVVGDEVSLNK